MNSRQFTNSIPIIPVDTIPNIPERPHNKLGAFTQAPVVPILPPFHKYYNYPYNNREKYTNWKIFRFRDFLYPDAYPIVQSDR